MTFENESRLFEEKYLTSVQRSIFRPQWSIFCLFKNEKFVGDMAGHGPLNIAREL
jgi:hypothetical protein